jgi:hypothetical protein
MLAYVFSCRLPEWRAHTLTVDFFTHTTYSGIFDGSVATINVEKCVVRNDGSSTEEEQANKACTQTLW